MEKKKYNMKVLGFMHGTRTQEELDELKKEYTLHYERWEKMPRIDFVKSCFLCKNFIRMKEFCTKNNIRVDSHMKCKFFEDKRNE